MQKLVITGGKPLRGEIRASGAKNAALLAIEILAVSDSALSDKLKASRRAAAESVLKKDAEISAKFHL